MTIEPKAVTAYRDLGGGLHATKQGAAKASITIEVKRLLAMSGVRDEGEIDAFERFLTRIVTMYPTAFKGYLALLGLLPETSMAADDVIMERARQQEVEGWSTEHDDDCDDGELAYAAAAYVLGSPEIWPFDPDGLKVKSERENYVRAAALLIAEIERLDRLAATEKTD